MDMPINLISPKEIQKVIVFLDTKKASGYDLITASTLKTIPSKAIMLTTNIFNAILRTGFYPGQWKIAQIILIPKPGKNPNYPRSYRPISLLPVFFKVFESTDPYKTILVPHNIKPSIWLQEKT